MISKVRLGAKSRALVAATICVLGLSAVPAFSGPQATQVRENDVEKLLGQADDFYQKADYKLAIGCYLEASALSQSRMNLSRAYFGLSLCYFYLRDTAGTTKYIRKVLEVDPNKEISALFYPGAFVGLFDQIRSDTEAQAKIPTEQVTVPKPVPEKTEDVGKVTKDAKTKDEGQAAAAVQPPPAPAKKTAPAPQLGDFEVTADRSGHWEISVHYSKWSVNLIKTLFEGKLKNELGDEIQNQILKKSEAIQPGLVKLNYANGLAFDSDGSNYGVEVRYYARGRAGTFSLGFGLDKTDIALNLNGAVRQEFTNGGIATVDAKSALVMSPFSWHVNFRWEMGQAARFAPYFVVGFGFAPFTGTLTYSFTGTYQNGAFQQSITSDESKSLDQWSQDVDVSIPDILVILQLNFGIKAELYRGLALIGEAGIWDGFVLRGGLAYRF